MQIDFHHGATYAIARLAGLSPDAAGVVAYCAEYVDDATNSGVVDFEDGSHFSRISSAHKLLDYRNFQELAASRVWIPFHFLPGNGGLPAGQEPRGGRIERLVCRPDSPVARDMVRLAILGRERPWGLHRLGITMHVFADTWAHQGFAGVNHKVNVATDIRLDGEPALSLRERLANYFVGTALPLGHGAVLSFPDRPWIRWSYVDGFGRTIERDNHADFQQAAHRMCQVMRQYVLGDPDAAVSGLPRQDRQVVAELLRNDTEDYHARHEAWLEAIEGGRFSFGKETVRYVGKGPGSWKHTALGTEKAVDGPEEVFPRLGGFEESHWKRFHDALQAHRLELIHLILPRYGILTA